MSTPDKPRTITGLIDTGVLDALDGTSQVGLTPTDSVISNQAVAMPRVKICGYTRVEDVQALASCRPDYIGMIFHDTSPRRVPDLERADAIAALAHSLDIGVVAVTVNKPVREVLELHERLGLAAVQLHGDEDPAQVAMLVARGVQVWKALRVGTIFDPELALRHREAGAWAIVLDTYREGQPGGTGEHFDWMIAAELAQELPVVLAGGLRPENVRAAVQLTGPWAVDVASSLETRPGHKDQHAVCHFIEEARRAAENPDAARTL